MMVIIPWRHYTVRYYVMCLLSNKNGYINALGPRPGKKPRPTASIVVYLRPPGHFFYIAWPAILKIYDISRTLSVVTTHQFETNYWNKIQYFTILIGNFDAKIQLFNSMAMYKKNVVSCDTCLGLNHVVHLVKCKWLSDILRQLYPCYYTLQKVFEKKKIQVSCVSVLNVMTLSDNIIYLISDIPISIQLTGWEF